MNRIENWSIVAKSPYHPPEYGQYLAGAVYNHPTRPDGDRIQTSRIVSIKDGVATTNSGSLYQLGKIDPEYVEFCKKNNLKVPTGE